MNSKGKNKKPLLIVRQMAKGGKCRGKKVMPGETHRILSNHRFSATITNVGKRPFFVRLPVDE